MKYVFALLLMLGINQTFAQVNYLDKGMGNSDITRLGASIMDWIGTNSMEEIWTYCDKTTKVDTNDLKVKGALISDEYQYEAGTEPTADLKENESNIGWYERTFYKQDKTGIKYLLQIKVGLRQVKEKQLITYIKFLKGAEIHTYNKDILAGASEDNKPPPPPPSRLPKKAEKNDEEED